MAYRNWKQEVNYKARPRGRRRRGVWLAGAAAVAVIAAACLSLWVWPGYLRDKAPRDGDPSAEDIYLKAGADRSE